MLGILAIPADTSRVSDVAVLIAVGGPQYRAGSHRQFVLLARHLARSGTPALRFDYRGMGDSEGHLQTFEQTAEDFESAVNALIQTLPNVRRVVIWGLCDAASAALLYLHQTQDPRIAGLIMANPWVRSAQSLARAHAKHYYLQRLQDPAFWRKLLSGGVALSSGAELMRNLRSLLPHRKTLEKRSASLRFQDRMIEALRSFAGRSLILLSENDLTAQEFRDLLARDPDWQQSIRSPSVNCVTMAGADHTFSDRQHMLAVAEHSSNWLLSL